MVKYWLKYRLECENVEKVIVPQRWCFTVQQSAGEEKKGPIFISANEEFEIEGSRGTANFVLKWPGNKKQSTCNVLQDKAISTELSGTSDDFQAVALFDCRGLDLVEFHNSESETFTVVAENSGTTFSDIDLTAGDWFDYDEKGSQSVEIRKFEWKLVRG